MVIHPSGADIPRTHCDKRSRCRRVRVVAREHVRPGTVAPSDAHVDDAGARTNEGTTAMPRNEHEIDRFLRVFLLAPLFVVLAFLVGPSGFFAVLFFVLAAIMFVTGFAGSCLLYRVFGIDTTSWSRS